MPPPTTTASRPGRYLAALAALLVVMLASVIGASFVHPGSWHSRFKVGLGLDLSSGTTVTLKAVPQKPNVPVPSSAMKQAISIFLTRVNGAGLNGATVQQQGTNIINISVPGQTSQQVINLIGTTGKLRFRQVILCSVTIPGSAQCTPSPTNAKAPATPAVSPSGSPSPPVSPSGSPAPSGSTSPSHSSSPKPKTSAGRSASPSPTASTKAAIRGASPRVSAAAERARAAALAPAASASPKPTHSAPPGKTSTSPSASAPASPTPSGTPTTVSPTQYVAGDQTIANPKVLKLFNELNCNGPPKVWQHELQSVIYKNNPNLWEEGTQIVSCEQTPQGNIKYLLGPAVVTGAELTSASANLDQSSQWVVDLTLNGTATRAFGDLTTLMYSRYYNPSTHQATSVLDEFAIVLNGQTQSAPQIVTAITTGNPQITGGGNGFTQTQAKGLAAILKYGELQLNFTKESVSTVSPQLGASQLQAGLIAGLVGLLLVVIYSFVYYRGLGLVSVSSLAIAASLTWLTVILLSAHAGFTLSLAGVAGMIVAIGITADSFVVFFERLRDEVREGRSLRAAVERGWARARRTILVSDTVSFLAAALLYYFAIGDVKGFAFTLGLTTLIDVVVVFLFTKPMVTLLARTKFYGGGHKLSGLDSARLGARSPWRGSRVAARPAAGGAATAGPGKPAPREA